MMKKKRIPTPLEVVTKMRKMRQEHGLNQMQVAAVLGISQPSLSKMENGHGEPTVTQFYAFCAFFNQPIQKVLG